jgi:hypothetical protein
MLTANATPRQIAAEIRRMQNELRQREPSLSAAEVAFRVDQEFPQLQQMLMNASAIQERGDAQRAEQLRRERLVNQRMSNEVARAFQQHPPNAFR